MTTPWGEALTASNLCNDAALQLGAIGEGEALADGQPADVLRRLNWLLDGKTLDRSKIFRYSLDSGSLVAAQAQYSVGDVGSGANFAVAGGRPLRLWWAWVRNENGIDIPVPVAHDRAAYDDVPNKASANSNYPQIVFYDPQYPLGQFFFWPVPTLNYQFFWVADGKLATLPTLGTAIAFPPGYYRWLVNALAIELEPYFQMSAPQTVYKAKAEAAADLARYNRVDPHVGNDAAESIHGGYFDIYRDGFGGRQ